MWKRKVTDDYLDNLGKKCTYLNYLWKCDHAPIYIMDNHLAAAWCWMQECSSDEDYNFIHIDQHSDLKGCGHTANIEFIRTNQKITLDDYIKISYTTHKEFQFFQWDNYIRACHYLFPKWFNSNLFYYTKPYLGGSAYEWGYKDFSVQRMDPFSIRQDITHYIKEQHFFSDKAVLEENKRTKKWIVNIDLDSFWDTNKIKVFDNQFINDLGKRISDAMKNIQVLTIALSPSCCGGWDNAIECSKTFLLNPMMIELCIEYLKEEKLFPNGWHN